MTHRPNITFGNAAVVIHIREHPLRGALKNVEMRNLISNGRRNLESACTSTNLRDAFTRKVKIIGPAGRMKRRPVELFHARNIGHPRCIQRTGSTHDNICLNDICAAVRCSHFDRPGRRRFVPCRFQHLSVEATLFVHPILTHHPFEVRPKFRLPTEVFAPVIRWLERVAVEVTTDVDAGTGIPVVAPCSSGTVGLLDDRVRNARLIEANSRQEPGLTASDHNDMKRVANLLRNLVFPRDCSAIGTIEMKVIGKHRYNCGIHRCRGHEVHEFFDQFGRRHLRFGATCISPLCNHGNGTRTDLGLFIGRQSTFVVVEDRHTRANLSPDPCRIARHMDH